MSIEFQHNKPLSEVCTLGIGGPARYFVEVHSIEQLQQALTMCKEEKLNFLILGKGSNCLFDDRGFNGAVIFNKIDFLETLEPGVFHVGAGFNFSRLGSLTARQGWSGLEFASGIPGTVGGAVYMNAGANGTETCKSLIAVDYVTDSGEIQHLQKEDLSFSYRTSSFQKINGAIAAATFKLTPSSEARTKQLDIITYRKNTQPYGDKSAGCMFRNPTGNHAGALIEQCGLKGYTLGGARVSELHANFIINSGKGTAQDILELIRLIKKQVREKTGYDLETEVKYIPYE